MSNRVLYVPVVVEMMMMMMMIHWCSLLPCMYCTNVHYYAYVQFWVAVCTHAHAARALFFFFFIIIVLLLLYSILWNNYVCMIIIHFFFLHTHVALRLHTFTTYVFCEWYDTFVIYCYDDHTLVAVPYCDMIYDDVVIDVLHNWWVMCVYINNNVYIIVALTIYCVCNVCVLLLLMCVI